MKERVIVLHSEETLLELVRSALECVGYRVDSTRTVKDAVAVAGRGRALVVLDSCLSHVGGPPGAIRDLRRGADPLVLQISGCQAVDAASRLHAVRADAFLVRPFAEEALREAVEALRERGPGPGAPDFAGMYGRSAAMRSVFEAVRLVAPTSSTVLITGETGTGKELVARAIHDRSAVRDGPFVPVDCGSLPDSLLSSELFGHARGAFTGAVDDRTGLVEAASGGTLFLDEVGNTPPRLQMLLLRVLQEQSVRRVGRTDVTDVDVRVVAATNMDLAEAIGQGHFREDLYYRLKVFTIHVPPLRERRTDVDRIVRACLDGAAGRGDTSGDDGRDGPAGITAAAMEVLRDYTWPGNVRELEAVLDCARIRAAGGVVDVPHLAGTHRLPNPARKVGRPGRGPAPGSGGTESEARRILRALEACDGNRTEAAKRLGISRTTLWRRIRSLELEWP